MRIEHLFMLSFAFFAALGHPLARIIVRHVHPVALGVLTLGSGSLVILLFLAVTGRLRLLGSMSGKDVLRSAGIGVIGFFAFQMLTFSALSRIPASVNAFLINSSVVYIAVLAALVLRERIRPAGAAGIALALVGVLLVAFNRGFRVAGDVDLLGCAFSLLGAVSFALYSVFGKRLLARNDPLLVTALAMLTGTLLLGALAALTTGFGSLARAPASAWALALVVGVTMNGLAYPLWFLSLRSLPASHVSVYMYLTPLFAVALSYFILRETFAWLFWLGAALILAGIALSSRRGGYDKPASDAIMREQPGRSLEGSAPETKPGG
jgi:drug/metabolite transporter (DMT)-like permease